MVLVSCSADQAANTEVAVTAPALTPTTTVPAASYNTDISIREIMASLIDPQADKIWNSVRVISDSNGITEYTPETDEEWGALRRSTIAIIEGSNALMMPGRSVAPPGAQGEFPEYEFTPEEVQARLEADFTSWTGFAENLQDNGLGILDAIDNRDTEKLSEWGAYLDEACEACHSAYWYRVGI